MRNLGHTVRALSAVIVLSAVAAPAQAQSREIIGYAGVLGEWEVNAKVTEGVSARPHEFSGPLTMRHVGVCTQDGPEEKTGQLRLQISPSSSRLDATLLVAGVACTYSGRLSDSYTGIMTCPDRTAVPLRLWVR
jgi:hypothetical protein